MLDFDPADPHRIPRHLNLREIADAHPNIISDLRLLHPIETAAMFSGLLAIPELHSNCIRVEALVHLALTYCAGDAAPTEEFVKRCFDDMANGYCGRMEDPSEDVFATLVSTPRGNFRMINGSWESFGFHLQRMLEVVEGMPKGRRFADLHTQIASLLSLSDAVAHRFGVKENTLGQEIPLGAMPPEIRERLATSSAWIKFTGEELTQLGISLSALSEFTFDFSERSKMEHQYAGHTDLERRPISVHEGCAFVLLPTAIGPAIIRYLIEWAIDKGLEKTLQGALCDAFLKFFRETHVLGQRLPPTLAPRQIDGGSIASTMMEVDPGRFLHLFLFVDSFDNFSSDGFNGSNANGRSLSSALRSSVRQASAEAKEQKGFRDGISLIVACGYGRSLFVEIINGKPTDWRSEVVAAHDLASLSWLAGFDALSLWRLLDSRDALKKERVEILNVNGLLNLVAWSRQLEGHLVPHGRIPDDFLVSNTHSRLVIRQNALRELRHNIAVEWSPRRALDQNGKWVKVRKLDRSEFEEDNSAPLYGSEEDVHAGKLRAVYVAPLRPWWVEITAPEDSPRDSVYQYWTMLCRWLTRAAPILDTEYESLPPTPVAYRVHFAEAHRATAATTTPIGLDALRRLVRVSAESGPSNILIHVCEGFDNGFSQTDNFAEQVLVEALVAGAAKLGGGANDHDKQARLTREICPNAETRSMHRFQAHLFRDYVAQDLGENPILIDETDDAFLKIGLGWKARSKGANSLLTGIPECTAYLNQLVRVVMNEICQSLHSLDRESFVKLILLNHEIVAHDRDNWKRTARANLAMHWDKDAALRTICEHDSRLNTCFAASRILLEAALCECPLAGGRDPGRLDLTRALAQALQAFAYGGWSDAIHWGAMEPMVKITPLGDIHVNHDFVDDVYEPFSRDFGGREIKRAADSYSKIYETPAVLSSMIGVVEEEFLKAWEAEFGSAFDVMRLFIDQLNEKGLHPPNAIVQLRRSELRQLIVSAGASPASASATLSAFTLEPRPTWRTVGSEFTDRDWFPWRFRRRLSVLRRPFLQLDGGVDPMMIAAPGLVQEAFFLTASTFHRGEIPTPQARSREMSSWIGRANNVQRTKFNSDVAHRMQELGWQVEKEITLTKLLGRSLDRDYGDIDVLAWRANSPKVLVIECKDLQFQKTLGEVAEQLADFSGEIRSDGKPDVLRRHLDRLAVLDAHLAFLSEKLGIPSPVQVTGHLVFKNPVPMRFAASKITSKTHMSLFEELSTL